MSELHFSQKFQPLMLTQKLGDHQSHKDFSSEHKGYL